MAGGRLLFIVNDTTFFASHRLPVAVAAREAGFEVALAALDTGRLDQIRAQGIVYHPLAVDRTGINPVRDVRLFCQLRRLIRRVCPTLVHAVTIKPVIYGGIAARLGGVPGLVSAVSGLGLVFVDDGRKALMVRVVRALYRLALGHRNSCAIFQNPDDRQHMVDAGLVPGERTVLIRGSGVDVTLFQPSPPPPGPPVVVLPGRLLWHKGVGEFVEAARLLRRRVAAAHGAGRRAARAQPGERAARQDRGLGRRGPDRMVGLSLACRRSMPSATSSACRPITARACR